MKNEKFELDYTPTVVYTMDKPDGIGKLYFNGKQIKGLIDIKMSAHTKCDTVTFATLKLEVSPITFADSITNNE
jgi:hypothetical protein